jgi:antitoxin component YwqK of YwqJK toxin-antitoxin module
VSEVQDKLTDRVECDRAGSVCAKGKMLGDQLHGYWEWYRGDGTLKRSGSFDRGCQVGEWTTYDQGGAPYKITRMKEA